MLNPDKDFLQDDVLADVERSAAVRRRGGVEDEERSAARAERDRAHLESEHNHLEGLIREQGPRQNLVERLNRFRERLGWDPKAFGDWTPPADAELEKALDRAGRTDT